VGILHDQVLVEEAEGLFVGGGGQADEKGIEVFEHLAPEVVNGAVALVGDDKIKGLDGDGGVVFDGRDFLVDLCSRPWTGCSSSSSASSWCRWECKNVPKSGMKSVPPPPTGHGNIPLP